MIIIDNNTQVLLDAITCRKVRLKTEDTEDGPYRNPSCNMPLMKKLGDFPSSCSRTSKPKIEY